MSFENDQIQILSNEEFKQIENEKITNNVSNISYNEFANRSIELLENNIRILNKYFNLKGPMSKFFTNKQLAQIKYTSNWNWSLYLYIN